MDNKSSDIPYNKENEKMTRRIGNYLLKKLIHLQ